MSDIASESPFEPGPAESSFDASRTLSFADPDPAVCDGTEADGGAGVDLVSDDGSNVRSSSAGLGADVLPPTGQIAQVPVPPPADAAADMLRISQEMQRERQMTDMLSNVMKKQDETMAEVARQLRD